MRMYFFAVQRIEDQAVAFHFIKKYFRSIMAFMLRRGVGGGTGRLKGAAAQRSLRGILTN